MFDIEDEYEWLLGLAECHGKLLLPQTQSQRLSFLLVVQGRHVELVPEDYTGHENSFRKQHELRVNCTARSHKAKVEALLKAEKR